MNDLSVFDGDGDAERDRQICDLRIRGKTEPEVMAMLGCTVPDIHRALDRAAQASMTPHDESTPLLSASTKQWREAREVHD